MGIAALPLVIGAVGALASAGGGIMSAMQKPPKPPEAPKPATDTELTNQTRLAEDERKRKTGAMNGQGSTILTSPLGVEDTGSGDSGTTILGS